VKITVIATGFRKDLPSRQESSGDARSLKPEAPAFLNLDVRPSVPRFASEVATEAARANLNVPESAGATPYVSGFGSQSLASLESTPSFEPIAVHAPVSKERKSAAATPEDAAIGGFLETLTADETRAREQRRVDDAELEELDVPAFMRKGGR
jgi:hypothetical protein